MSFKRASLLLAGLWAVSVTAMADEQAAMQQDIANIKQQLRALQAKQQGRAAQSANPDVSLILSGIYGDFKNDPEQYHIPGISRAEETGPGGQGLSLAESELIISSNIDDLFYGLFTAALTPENEVEVEEAFIQSLALPAGFTAQAGRFYSELGYLNAQHPHSWHFVDTALVYRALLGNHYGDDGIQLRWLAPTDFYLELGTEVFSGDSYPMAGRANDGQGAQTAFIKLGGDVGASHSWLAGYALLQGDARERMTEEDSVAFSGEVEVQAVELVWKWAPQGDASRRHLIIQAEWLERQETGSYSIDAIDRPIDARQSGWYGQVVYQFMPHWRFGLRYDRLKIENPGSAFDGTSLETGNHQPERSSMMLDYSRSEFSRIRVQYNRDESGVEPDDQWFLQYIVSMGAHGAHRF